MIRSTLRQSCWPSALLALAFWLVSGSAAAQILDNTGAGRPRESRRLGTAAVITTAPVIDGHLNDPIWSSGQPFEGFVQRELHPGAPVTERTIVRILTDGEALYVGAWLYDREPSGIVPGEKLRDVTLTNSDYFGLILDTYLDRQNGFIFATTPVGVEYDAQVVKEGEGGGVFQQGQTRAQSGSMGGFNLNWDATWRVATSIDSAGWYAEFRIPFSTLRYGGGRTQQWGLNLVRSIRRKNEEAFWSVVPRQFSLMRLSSAGTLEGIEVPVRRVATMTPYALSRSSRDFAVESHMKSTGEFGVDAKYGLTPSLTLDLTYNTDFAQVEVDEQRTNLTRFPLFFPEKRPFFLENAGVFSAGTPQAVELFFSRRIGIDTAGRVVPILGGGRLTGRVAGFTVGGLGVVSDHLSGGQPRTAYAVQRVSREVGRRSRVGLIGVQRQATGDSRDHNRLLALDGRVGVGDAWTIDWWGARTATPDRHGDDLGFSTRAGYQTSAWNNTLRFVQVGEDFNPEVGFLNRTGGYRYYEFQFMRYLRNSKLTWLKDWNPHWTYRGYYTLDGFWQSGQHHFDVTEVSFARGGRFGPELNVYHEGLRAPFAIASNVTLPKGSYDWTALGLDWETNASAPISFVLRGDFGPFYNGHRNGVTTTITGRKGASFSASVQIDYQNVQLDQGDFIRSLVGYRASYFFTPRVFVQSLVQYNNQQRVWTANGRFAWLNTAGTGLFVVFNEGEEANGFFDWVRPRVRSFAVKYTRQLGTN